MSGGFLVERFFSSGMSTQQLANWLGVDNATVWRWVYKNSTPHPYMRSRLRQMGLLQGSAPVDVPEESERGGLAGRVRVLTQQLEDANKEIERLRDLLGKTIDLRDFPFGGVISEEKNEEDGR